jgi:purine nucleoside phosphorylase
MGSLAGVIHAARVTRFDEIEGVGACGVGGHAGEVREGKVGPRDGVVVLGRRHVYEGAADSVLRLVAWLAGRGVTDLVVTSAAGALHRGLVAGELVVVRDLCDRQNRPSLIRVEAGRAGGPVTPERASVANARTRLDRNLTASLERAATCARVAWQRGTLVCGAGPAYETLAEVRAYQESHGDVATMSGAPEIAAANRVGMRAAALAVVTNPCTGVAAAVPNHREVLEVGARAAGHVAEVIMQLFVEI